MKEKKEKIEAPKRRKGHGIIWLLLILIIGAVFYMFPKLVKVKDNTGSSVDKKLITENVEKKDISSVVKLSGSLVSEDTKEFALPETITVTEYYVKNGDSVSVGDKVAKVDVDSVYYTAGLVQARLDKIDDETTERKELEKLMVTLNSMIVDNHIYAEADGVIDGVDEDLYVEAEKETGNDVASIIGGSGMGMALYVSRYILTDNICNFDLEGEPSGNQENELATEKGAENGSETESETGENPADQPSTEQPSTEQPPAENPDVPAEEAYDVYPAIVTGVTLNSITVAYAKDAKQVKDYKELTSYDFTVFTAEAEETIKVSGDYKIYTYSNNKWSEKSIKDISLNDNVIVLSVKDTGITNSNMLVLCKNDQSANENPGGTTPGANENPGGANSGNGSNSGNSSNSGNGTFPGGQGMPSGQNSQSGSKPSGGSYSGIGQGSGYSNSGLNISGMNIQGITNSGSTTSAITYLDVEEVNVYTVTPANYMTFEISIDELDIGKVSVGANAKVYISAISKEVDGTVYSLSRIGENSGGNTKYQAYVKIEKTEEMLSGMNAAADVNYNDTKDVCTVSIKAIYEDEEGSFVYTGYDEKESELKNKVYVETGVSDGETVEITSGLSEGQTVYYEYADEITYTFK